MSLWPRRVSITLRLSDDTRGTRFLVRHSPGVITAEGGGLRGVDRMAREPL